MAFSGEKDRWTVLELLNWTTDYFGKSNIRDARLNAELLLGQVLGLERIMLYARFDEEVARPERERIRELVRQRAAHRPLQYLLGHCEFYGRRFQVGPAVMVPRQETELLVEKCLEKLPAGEAWAADVGTGSGVVAVTLAAERAELHVVATDPSEEALRVAERNAARHGVAERVLLARGELAEPVAERLPPGRSTVDLLASNPPYVPTDRIEQLEPEVRDHEPRRALDGGPGGLTVLRGIVHQAPPLIGPGGWLALEVGEGQARAVIELVRDTKAFEMETVETVTDAGGCERVLCVRRAACGGRAAGD
jgi:release factor glutamine methyltransferase